MLKELFFKELHDLLISLRFHLALLTIVILMSAAASYTSTYRDAVADHYRGLNENETLLTSVQRLSDLVDLRQTIFKPPSRLAFLADGKEELLPNTYSVAASVAPVAEVRSRRNLILGEFSNIDLVFIVGVLISFMAIILTYDAVSGEKELGTLKQMLANSVSRSTIIAAKFLSASASLLAAFLTGFMMALLLLLTAGIAFSPEDVWRILAVLIISASYIALFVALGLFLSTLAHNSITSLVVALLIWALLVVVVPDSGGLLASKIYGIPRFVDVQKQITAASAEVDKEYRRIPKALDLDDLFNPLNRPWAEWGNKRRVAYESIHINFEQQRFQQILSSFKTISFSPYVLYRRAAEKLLNIDIERQKDFLQQAFDYRERLRQFIRSVDSTDPKSPHIYYYAFFTSQKEIAPSAVPRFAENTKRFRDSLSDSIGYVSAIICLTLVLVIGGFVSFLRYDIR